MPNGYFNNQVRNGLAGGAGTKGFMGSGAGKGPAFKEKPGFATGVPGKTQPTDRSNGVKRIKAYPSSDGL